jgi:hypothetical protein
MQVYLFTSLTYSLRALALDDTGSRLPAAYGPWEWDRRIPVPIANMADRVYMALIRDGFFLMSGSLLSIGAYKRARKAWTG